MENYIALVSYAGVEEGLRILDAVKSATGLPVITDIHEVPFVNRICNSKSEQIRQNLPQLMAPR